MKFVKQKYDMVQSSKVVKITKKKQPNTGSPIQILGGRLLFLWLHNEVDDPLSLWSSIRTCSDVS